MKKEKVEFKLQLGECSEKLISEIERGLDVKCEGEGNDIVIKIYADYEHVDELLGLTKSFLDHDIPVVIRKCYEEVEDIING